MVISLEHNLAALDRMASAWESQIAELRWSIELHRDVLKSPKETIDSLENTAAKAIGAWNWCIDQKRKLLEANK